MKLISGSSIGPVAALGLVLLGAAPAFAEGPPHALVEARAAFAKALAARDVKALEGLAHFPLANAVQGEPPTIPAAKFAAQVKSYWREAGCLKAQPLERAAKDQRDRGEWLVACDGGNNIFYFKNYDGRWLHGAFENVGE